MAFESEAWTKTIFKFLTLGRYNTTPPTLANGDAGELQVDANGNLRVAVAVGAADSEVDPQWYATGNAGAASGVVVATPRIFRMAYGINTGPNARAIMFFDSATMPSNGTVPKHLVLVPAGEMFSITAPQRFTTGICWAASSTNFSLTIDTGALFAVRLRHAQIPS